MEPHAHLPDWDAWQAAYDELEPRSTPSPRCRARSPGRRQRLLAAMQLADDIGQLDVQGLVLRVALVRRGSARQPDQRPAAAGPDPVREGRAGVRRGSIPSCWRFRCADRAAVDGREQPSSRSTASRSRISTASRSTCSTKRASTCCRCRAASRRRRTTPTRRCRPPTSSIRPITLPERREVTLTYGQYRAILATNRESGRPRGGVSTRFTALYEASLQHLRVALQRRAAARLVPRAGARLSRRRSMRRCTATTSRPRWSRT